VHKDGVKNSYHTPTTVVQAKVVTGIYPYVSPGSNVPSSRITTGWFKEGYEPSSSASASVSMPTLKSFTASVSKRKISVEFTKAASSSSGYKTYKVNGKSYSLPYLGDLSSITASVTYHVDVLDSSGTTVHSEDLSSNTGTLNYTPSAGTYTVVGYYVNGDSTSNKIKQNVTVKSFFGGLLNIGSSTANSIGVSVEVPEGNSIAISLSSNGAVLKSTNVTYDQSFNFTNLSPSTTYTITAVETTADGESKQIASKTITTAGDSTTEDETTESQDN
jgi:penicillin-binding protein 1A